MDKNLLTVLIASFDIKSLAPGAAFLFPYSRQDPAIISAALFEIFTAVSHLTGRRYALLDYQLPHGKLWLFYLNIWVVFSQVTDHLRRVNGGLVKMSVKLDA